MEKTTVGRVERVPNAVKDGFVDEKIDKTKLQPCV